MNHKNLELAMVFKQKIITLFLIRQGIILGTICCFQKLAFLLIIYIYIYFKFQHPTPRNLECQEIS